MSNTLSLSAKTPKPDTAPKKVWVRTVQGEMVHLFTSFRFSTRPERVVLDQFVQTQIDAGKLLESDED